MTFHISTRHSQVYPISSLVPRRKPIWFGEYLMNTPEKRKLYGQEPVNKMKIEVLKRAASYQLEVIETMADIFSRHKIVFYDADENQVANHKPTDIEIFAKTDDLVTAINAALSQFK